MPHLRGHHFICLHFLTGRNAGPAFITNMEEVKGRALREGVVLADGIDDICGACPSIEECRGETEKGNKVRAMDAHASELLKLEKGRSYGWTMVADMVRPWISIWRDTECISCPEYELCKANPVWDEF